MSRRVDRVRGFFALLAAFIALLVTGGVAFEAEAASRTANATPKQAGEGPAPRILVLPFQINAGPDMQHLNDSFHDTLAQRMAAKGIQVVPTATMLRLLETRRVSTLDASTVRSLASAAGATHAVYGTVSQLGDAVSIDARLVSVSEAHPVKPLFVEQREGRGTVAPAIEDLAARVNSEFLRKDAIAGVEVRGTKVLDPDVVLMRINTRKGDLLDSAAVDREVKRIWELGYFSDVQVDLEPRDEGLVLVYTVTEKPRIETIAVEGAHDIDKDDILSVMSSKAGSILNEKLLADDIQKILELYRKDGFYLAKVDQRVDARQGGASAALVLTITEGKKLYIKKVSLEGVKQLDESDVKKQMLLSERSIISWITGTGVLKEELIERDSSAIASYYLDRGFMDVTVGAAKIDYEEDGITVTLPVDEGPRYTLGEVTFAGDIIDTDERLRSIVELDEMAAKKEYFNLSVMQSDTKKLTDFYADYGYAFAEVNPKPMKTAPGSSEHIVNVTYDIDKKNKIFIRQVVVEGNNKTRDNVILREMRLTDAEQFDGAKLRRSMERLNKLGYFEVAEAELVPTPNEDEVDLKVKVKERPTGALMGGIGYSTYSAVGVSGTLMERNLWGKGYNVSLQAGFSGRRDAYTFSFTNPRWNDTPLSVGVDLYHWRDDYIDYRKRTTGGVLRFAYPVGEYTSIGWGYRLDRYELYDLEDDVSQLIAKYADGIRYTSVALARIARDTTDRERPTSGNIDRLGVEYGGGLLAGDDDFITVSAEHQTYYQLVPNHVLHGRIKGSAIFKNGSDDVPVFERFWMGGMDSVRGYDSRDIVPRDPETGDRIGGTRMAFANMEYIWTVNSELGLSLVPFFDIGFNLDADHDYSWSDEIKRSFGLEMRWRSPMGDLRFSYGIPLDENRNGKRDSGRFEFSMGQFF